MESISLKTGEWRTRKFLSIHPKHVLHGGGLRFPVFAATCGQNDVVILILYLVKANDLLFAYSLWISVCVSKLTGKHKLTNSFFSSIVGRDSEWTIAGRQSLVDRSLKAPRR